MRYLVLALPLLLGQVPAAQAQVSVGIGLSLPGVSIGIDVPSYPQLVLVPGYPVYYAPRANSNYFFYDGLYWVFEGDEWYSSGWYNGPWQQVGPEYVPLYVLRVPVRYYREPPVYFRGWRPDAPPQWGRHWGRDWEDRRRGWDRWDHRDAPRAAPLPIYQRNYAGDRYPREVEQQRAVRRDNYRYQPREAITRQYEQRPDQQRDQQRDQPNYRQRDQAREQQRGAARAEVRQPVPVPQRAPPPQQPYSQPDQPRQQTRPVPAAQPQPQRESQGQGQSHGRGREAQDRAHDRESPGRGRDKKND